MTDPQAIADGLSEAETAALLQFEPRVGALLFAENECERALCHRMMNAGLVGYIHADTIDGDMWGMDLRELGASVRAILAKEEK